MTSFPSFAYLIVFIFGLIFGSFFNVLIHRIPKSIQSAKKESLFNAISFPKSYCPKCKKSLLIHHNLPIISWLFLLGKCYFCKAKISIRYPLVELLSAFIFLFCFLAIWCNNWIFSLVNIFLHPTYSIFYWFRNIFFKDLTNPKSFPVGLMCAWYHPFELTSYLIAPFGV